jgi:lipopolysaccharide transport system ATP-binding protein
MPIIQVDHLTKEYRLGAMKGLKQTLLNGAARLTGKKIETPPLFKALDDVSFSIEPGEVVGIIGHNGAGKSTLLKMLAKISTPTSGSVKVDGLIAPLIEVGAGFVPDFTGRENVYLNGSILGLTKKEIDAKFDEIVDFAEMSEFIDTPVKRYSSGMQVKLAFSVATSIEAEILIVDEVLAVGDLAFQRKCFDRMEQLIKKEGRTVLLVSHNIRQIERICGRVLLLNHGKITMNDAARLVCNTFYEQSDQAIIAQQKSGGKSRLVSTGDVEIIDLYFTDDVGIRTGKIEYSSDVSVVLEISCLKDMLQPVFHIGIHTTDFVYLTTTSSPDGLCDNKLLPGIYKIKIKINNFSLLPGAYSIRVSIDVENPIKNILYGDGLFHFTVTSTKLTRSSGQCEGFFMLDSSWAIECAPQL